MKNAKPKSESQLVRASLLGCYPELPEMLPHTVRPEEDPLLWRLRVARRDCARRHGHGLQSPAGQLNRLVALKLINAGVLASHDLVKRFKAEAEAAADWTTRTSFPSTKLGSTTGSTFSA